MSVICPTKPQSVVRTLDGSVSSETPGSAVALNRGSLAAEFCSLQHSRWGAGAVLRKPCSQPNSLQAGAEAGSKLPAAAQKKGISSLTVFAVHYSCKCWCENCVSDGMTQNLMQKKQSSSEGCWLLASMGCRRHNSPFLPSVWSRCMGKYYLTRWKCPDLVVWSSPVEMNKMWPQSHGNFILRDYCGIVYFMELTGCSLYCFHCC